MTKLYSWEAFRSGASITIKHSCGKITSVECIYPLDGKVVARTSAGQVFELA